MKIKVISKEDLEKMKDYSNFRFIDYGKLYTKRFFKIGRLILILQKR